MFRLIPRSASAHNQTHVNVFFQKDKESRQTLFWQNKTKTKKASQNHGQAAAKSIDAYLVYLKGSEEQH